MATVYSLVCFGGLSGKTVTFTDAGDIVNLSSHGLRQGVTGIVFSTTGSLPTGITAGTTYYPRDGADANKFTIYPTKADALAGTNQVTFTGTGSGTHTVKSAYMLGLTSAQLARYGSSGSERIYDGLGVWQTQRNYKPVLNDREVCEIGDAFTEKGNTNLSCAAFYSASSVLITSSVNGIRTDAWHSGSVTDGYCLESSSSTQVLGINTYDLTIDGIRVYGTYNGGVKIFQIGSVGYNPIVKNCIIEGNPSATTQIGLQVDDSVKAFNNIVFNVGGTGVFVNSGKGALICNNLVTKCTKGFDGGTASQGFFANNIVIGNTLNYEEFPRYISAKAFNNSGETSDIVSFSASSGSQVLTFASSHYRQIDSVVVFDSTGTLPTVGGVPLVKGQAYTVKTVPSSTSMTISSNQGSTTFTFDGGGTGTHTMFLPWCSSTPTLIDMSAPANTFEDYANNDFRLSATSALIDSGLDLTGISDSSDILGIVRPNYQALTYPDNYWDVGPFEYDHGDGDVPETLTISNLTTGTRVIATRADTGATLGTAVESGGTATISIGYSGTVNVEARNASGSPAYKPWTTQISFPSTKNVIALQEVD